MTRYRIGELIGPYRLVSALPPGGMATIYMARPLPEHTGPSQVVLKVAADGHNDFLKYEVEMMLWLQHPGILRLLPIAGHHSTGPLRHCSAKVEPNNPQSPFFVVMEYMPGGSLDRLITQATPLSPGAAIYMTLQVADALAYIHDRHMVHLDVKPNNLLLRVPLSRWSARLPVVVLSDFGIAQFTGGTRYTRAFGSTGYTAPEIVAGHLPHPQNDVYALGVILYEMLTGRTPFDGPVMPGIPLHPQFYPSRWNRAVSPELEAVILQAIDTDPRRRYASMQQFQQALASLSEAQYPARLKLPFIRGMSDRAVYGLSGAILVLLLVLTLVLGIVMTSGHVSVSDTQSLLLAVALMDGYKEEVDAPVTAGYLEQSVSPNSAVPERALVNSTAISEE